MPDDITTSPDSDSPGEPAQGSDRPADAEVDDVLTVPPPPESPDIPVPHPGAPTPAPEVPDLPDRPRAPTARPTPRSTTC